MAITSEMHERWLAAAEATQIPSSFYEIESRAILSDKSPFKFGVFYNPSRHRRPGIETECKMCYELEEARKNPLRTLATNEIVGFTVIPNRYPSALGFSMAIPEVVTDKSHRPMYNSSDLGEFVRDVQLLLPFAKKHGFELYHQTSGAGATIPQHEHWHLTNWAAMYSSAEELYGFDYSEVKRLRGVENVGVMEGFPFAHLIFKDNDPEKIQRFILNMQNALGREGYANATTSHAVPHTFASGKEGILIAPFKCDVGKKMGSESPTGHWCVGSKEEYDLANYDMCLARLAETMFRIEEVYLQNFL